VPDVRCFHPHAEAQVAFDNPGHVPATPVRTLAADLDYMLAVLGTSNDVILVRRPPTAEHIAALAAIGLPTPEPVLAPIDGRVLPRKHALRERLDLRPRPWAWTPDTCAFFQPFRHGQPVATWAPGTRGRWSKAWAAKQLAAVYATLDAPSHDKLCEAVDIPVVATDAAAARAAITALSPAAPTAVVKAPFATAGRGALRFSTRSPELSPSEQGWLKRAVTENAVVVAPWRDRIADLSVQLDIDPDPTIDPVLGVTGLLCDSHGRYRGNLVNAPDDAHGCHHLLLEVARRIAAIVRVHGHLGPAGIDAMVFVDASGQIRLQPVLEINPRHTMGHLALGLRRFLAPSSVGRLVVLGPRDRICMSLVDVVAALSAALPPVRDDAGAIAQAAVPLNDPATATAHLALFLAAPDQDAIDAALTAV